MFTSQYSSPEGASVSINESVPVDVPVDVPVSPTGLLLLLVSLEPPPPPPLQAASMKTNKDAKIHTQSFCDFMVSTPFLELELMRLSIEDKTQRDAEIFPSIQKISPPPTGDYKILMLTKSQYENSIIFMYLNYYSSTFSPHTVQRIGSVINTCSNMIPFALIPKLQITIYS
jgi:hypothetical protein